MKIDSVFPKSKEKNSKKAEPAFIQVSRATLKLAGPRVALAQGFIAYRARMGCSPTGPEIDTLFSWGATAGWRACQDLRDLGAIAEGSFLKVSVESVRELGALEAIMLAQLQTYGQLRMARFVGGQLVVTARGLASLLGCHVDTALDALKRLSTGLTNKVRALQRKGGVVVVKARLELFRAAGRAMRVRLFGEREREHKAVKPAQHTDARSAAGGSSTSSVPSREEIAQMLRSATRQRVT